jgi:NAD(P)-dependent dehydrogenase (short-subunit alcohol dehydrogenase family)
MGVAVAALLLAAGDAVRAARAREEAREQALHARSELEPLRARLHAREGASRRDSTLRHQAELTAEAAPPRVIADLAALLPADARVGRLELHYGNRLELDFRVETRTPAAYDRLLEALAASGRLEAVVPGAETREGEVHASMSAVYRPRSRR